MKDLATITDSAAARRTLLKALNELDQLSSEAASKDEVVDLRNEMERLIGKPDAGERNPGKSLEP